MENLDAKLDQERDRVVGILRTLADQLTQRADQREGMSLEGLPVSLALTSGVNLRWLSEQTGVHESTLLRHYGSFVHTTEADARELAKIDPELPVNEAPARQIGHRLDTEQPREDFPLWKQASPTGFEPVLPT